MEPYSANYSPGGCSTVDPHGNTDEGHSVPPPAPSLSPSFHVEMYSIVLSSTRRNGILIRGRFSRGGVRVLKNGTRGAPEITFPTR